MDRVLPTVLTPLSAEMGRPLKYHEMVGEGLPSNSHVFILFSSPNTISLSSSGLLTMAGRSETTRERYVKYLS